MENAIAKLADAKAIITAAIEALQNNQSTNNSGSASQTEATPGGGDQNPSAAQSGTADDQSANQPAQDNLGPNADINTSSAGSDHTVQEHEITEVGNESEDGPLVDRVGVYEYDLGVYGDSVSSIDLSAVPGDAQLNLIGWDASGSAIVSIGEDGVIITVEASASAYLAELQYGAQAGPLSLDVEALIGARADVSADFSINPMEGDFQVEIEGGVVVGATINANGELDLNYLTVEAGATGVAGFAAEGNFEIGLENWQFEMDAGAKLAFLLGGGADISFSVDGKEIVMDLASGATYVWDQSGNLLGHIGNFVPDDIPFIPGI